MLALSVTPGRPSSCSSNGPNPSPHTPAPGGGWERQTPDHISIPRYIGISVYLNAYIHCGVLGGSVANDLKTHPHCEDAFVKKRLNRRRHLQAQTHSEDALGEDALECADALAGADAL